MTKKEQAQAYHKQGYNCAQAVACTFAEELGIPKETAFRMMEAYGFGMGTMGTCGALCGAAAVVGMVESDANLENPKSKKKSYHAMKDLTKTFEEKVGHTICHEIKGVKTGEVLRSCDGCITDAVEMLEEYLKAKEEATEE